MKTNPSEADQAIAALSAAIERSPREPQVYLQLGNLLAGQDRWDAAERCYAATCSLQPGNAVAQHNWGVALQELGRPLDAIPAFERALGVNPAYAAAYYGLGLAYRRIESVEAALLAFECAIQCDGADVRFCMERVRALIALGRYLDALSELDRMPKQGVHEAHNLRAIALKNLRRPQEALAAYDDAIRAKPDYAEALSNRANLRLQARKFSLALADLDRALALKPEMEWLRGTRLYAAAHLFEWQGHETELARIAEDVRQQRRSIQPLALQCLLDDPSLQQQAARLWTLATCAPMAPRASAEPAGKIRLAYVSRDFKSHPVSFLMAEVFELHDREKFEIVAINYGAASKDAMQERLRRGFDHFLDVEALSDPEIAALCQHLKLDIAVDLTGFTDGARSAIFAGRAAPIQVSYLGFLGTTGARLHDYLIADHEIIPAETRAFYDENIVYLPSYQANDSQRPRPNAKASRAELGLPEQGFVFCCFNNPSKITPAVFAAWMHILAAVPGSVLWVLDEDERAVLNLQQHAQELGVAPARIVFARRTEREDYLAKLGAADLFLDTWPYNAGTTASDALWMGLPVLTLQGQAFAARVASSLLKAMDLPELIAHEVEAYMALAVGLATQADKLAEVREKLARNRHGSRLFDTAAFTRSLERAYLEMQNARLAGASMQDITVL